MYKSFKIRLYPTKEQEQKMWRHIGSCRYIWNYMYDLQQQRYENGESFLQRFDMIRALKPLKDTPENKWLYDVSNTSLQIICSDLYQAYEKFFKGINKHPLRKNKKTSKPSFPTRPDHTWFNGKQVHIEKVGNVKYKSDDNPPIGYNNKFINPRVSYRNGKWILSFTRECENQAPILTDKPMGIDLGIKETMTVAFGNETIVYHNINKSKTIRRLEKRRKFIERSISRKYEVNKQGNKYIKTRNIERLENTHRKIHTRITNIRSNYIHQCTHELVLLCPCKVVMEDLNVQGMLKNKHLSKAISEQCFFEIIHRMKYKCEWNNIPFYQANRFYPSSKTCSCCGCIKSDLKLSDRTYVCKECGLVIDRDLNAAINLQRYEP